MPSVPTFSPSSCSGSVISGRGTDVKKRAKLKEIDRPGHAALYKIPSLMNYCSLGCFIATDCVPSVVYLCPNTDLSGASKVDASEPLEVHWPRAEARAGVPRQNGIAELIYAVRAAVRHMGSSGQPCQQQHQTVLSGSNEPPRTTDTSRLAPWGASRRAHVSGRRNGG